MEENKVYCDECNFFKDSRKPQSMKRYCYAPENCGDTYYSRKIIPHEWAMVINQKNDCKWFVKKPLLRQLYNSLIQMLKGEE